MNQHVCIVTGGSSGIGFCTAEALKKHNCKVYSFSRRVSDQEGITHISVDVTDESAVKKAVQTVYEAEGRIDILVNCAGFGISGSVEFTELADAKQQMDVNFFGTVNVTKSVLPFMRKAKNGRIVNISSIAAPIPIPFQAFYSATKAAMNSYTCALRNEVRPYKISVTAVQPGDIATGFTDARKKSVSGDDVYGGRIAKSVAKMEQDERTGMKPEVAGKYIASVALKKRVKPLYAIGFSYKCVYCLSKILPCNCLNFLIGHIYAK